jgi:hypothetical protein
MFCVNICFAICFVICNSIPNYSQYFLNSSKENFNMPPKANKTTSSTSAQDAAPTSGPDVSADMPTSETAAPATPPQPTTSSILDLNKESWDDCLSHYLFIQPHSGKFEKKTFKKNGKDITSSLFTIEGVNCEGKRILIEVWGDKPATLYQRLFEVAAEKGRYVFKINDVQCVHADDMDTLILMPTEPNDFQKRFKTVLKLQTRKKCYDYAGRKPEMTSMSFPKAVAWTPGAFVDVDGNDVPDPATWGDERVIDFAALLEEEELQISPAKRLRTG